MESKQEKPDLKHTERKKRPRNEVNPLDRLPPHSVEAEQGVLGCVLLDPTENIGLCVEKFRSGSDVFYDLRHRVLFELLVELFDKKQPIDIFTLSQSLRDRQQLDHVGGLSYLNDLMDKAPSGLNLPYYLEIVREKHVLRKMLHTCSDIVGRVFEEQDNVEALLDTVERDVLAISEERSESADRSIKALVRDAIGTLETYHKNQGMLTGLSTGFHDLDKMTHGLHGGEMVVVAARPSMGKTSLAMNIAEHVALIQNEPVGVFSLEMTAESLILRMLCSRARINLRAVRDGFFAERDFPRITQAATEMAKAPLFIDDTPGLSILQLRARARRMAQQHGIKLFVIDYLQL
ncbi:MAG TPA: replicative DNA helicase, partial [Verrucomicrobiales bacterium]|nr:replicative DNA helicase [Verrucomicrobiales bacterium]